MKSNPISYVGVILALFLCTHTQAQSFGTKASAVWITDCNQSNFFNTSGNAADLIGPAANVFDNANLGVHTQNSGSLILRGGQIKTFKDPASSNVCTVRMFYRIYPQAGVPGAFTAIGLPFLEDCNVAGSVFPSGGPCMAGDQKWQRVVADGMTSPYAPINLTNRAPGKYVLEVYYDASGSNSSTTLCNELVTVNNGGNNYKAFFSVQSPNLSSTNPSSCFGNEGSITIGGLSPGVSYDLTYTDDGSNVGPATFVANGAGQIIIGSLNKGFYSNFTLEANGCTTNLFTGLILSDPIFVPTFTPIAPFCAGSTAPSLPTTSNNGITGTWSPSAINNQTSGTYTFTPSPNQCGFPVTISVNVIPKVTPAFTFGTSLVICANGVVPALPNTSTNGISGTWNPSPVDNQHSDVYTFTPNNGQCATPTTFTVTVNPNITPVFSFGTSATICAGETVPALPATSANGISGTWSPSVVDNQNSGNYIFTPAAGQCATATSFAVTVNPNITPAFNFGTSLAVCAGTTVPILPGTSTNGIGGTWSPATISNHDDGTYTFTPTAGQCALPFTLTVTVAPNITPVFSFGTSLTICAGGAVPVLSTTSTNGVTGTWTPAVADNMNSGTYTFTPDAGLCATTSTFTVTINPVITPTFAFGTTSTICAGGSIPALTTTSTNGITGTWNPTTVSNQTGRTYTFTPAAGQCAVPVTFTVTVEPNILPVFSFGTSLAICAGGTVPALPNTSTNGITGTWNPSSVSNQASNTYIFTPTAGFCALPTTFTVTVTPNITPTFSFGTSLAICSGGTVPALPASSTNGITGTWAPSIVSNTTGGSYTFTPATGQCALPASFSVTVNPNILPAFGFGTALTICAGGNVPALITTSSNGITGTWSPSTADSQNPATYTFTPTAGQCATITSLTITVNPNILPVFAIGTSLSICAGGAVPSLPTVSTNGFNGTWSPSTVNNQASGTYTFTPAAGQCARSASFTVTVSPNIPPTFSFGSGMTICAGGSVPVLPALSTNGITGTWAPSVADNQNSGTYIFTPAAGQCATTTSFTVNVNPNVPPVFAFGSSLTVCAGGTVPALSTTSSNGITGTWSPSVVNNQSSEVYVFTPASGQCVTPGTTTFTVTVTSNILPAFAFGNNLTICAGDGVPALPATSTNGISGTWSPAVVSNQASGTYVFTAATGQCVTPFTFTVTVRPIVTPSFAFGTFQSVCIGASVPALVGTSTNGLSGTWTPSVIDNMNNGAYAFTPAPGQCANNVSFTLEVNPVPSVTVRADTSVYDGAVIPQYNFIASPGAVIAWTNSNPAIGLPASGTGNVPSFTGINTGSAPVTGTITVTPHMNGCSGTAQHYTITVLPLNKDVFVPNVFSPNRDGKNDILFAYGNYISKIEMRIFNQWGQQIAEINNKAQGWDGTHKGDPQPVGVYVYVLRAELTDGRIVNLKGSVTLVR